MSDNTETNKTEPLSQEERLALCQKLDDELDEFINSLERKRYTDGWPEDRWEEEMEKHPFFMKTVPENGEMSPLAEGLAQLKYDPNENTPLELANNYKEDGNFNFKHKNYRLAILAYTEGIKIRTDDKELNASLYNNRAAAHWFLKNYRTVLYDSEKALSFNASHIKARIRAAKAALQIGQYDICIDHCQKILESQPDDKDILQVLNIAKKKLVIQERDERKNKRITSKKEEQKELIVNAIKNRGIKISNYDDEDDLDLSKLEPTLPGAQDALVQIDNGILRWPILFLYPEFQITDLIKGCPENVPLKIQLEQLFPTPWDEDGKYTCNSINVYFDGSDKMPHVVDISKNLGDLLVSKHFELKAGTPAFHILVRGSKVEARFLERYLN